MKPLETLLWTMGVALLLAFFALLGWAEIEGRRDLHAFAMARQAAHLQELAADTARATARSNPREIAEPSSFQPPAAASSALPNAAIAVLRIRGIQLEVPVSPGTDEHVLQRGAGWIDGTAAPGSDGNVGIAAHRDSHFRGLKDVVVGDVIELDTLQRTRSYRVTDLSVVEPTDVAVLAETGEPILTLVTCFPFYFVGHAPQRFIVRAAAIDLGT